MASSSHIRIISPVSGYEGSAYFCVRVWMSRIPCLRIFIIGKMAVLAGKTNLQIRQRKVCSGPPCIIIRIDNSFRMVKLVPIPATNYCGRRCDRSSLAACGYEMRVKSNLLLWTPSLNKRSKLKGQVKSLKSGCGPSGGPSLSPQSLSYAPSPRGSSWPQGTQWGPPREYNISWP